MKAKLCVLGLLLIVACSTEASSSADYVLREGAIDGPSSLTSWSAVEIHASNAGKYSHTLVVTNDSGEVLGATGLVSPDQDASLEVDLEPGTYVFSCRIVAEDDEGNLVDHYEQGMHRTVAVQS